MVGGVHEGGRLSCFDDSLPSSCDSFVKLICSAIEFFLRHPAFLF